MSSRFGTSRRHARRTSSSSPCWLAAGSGILCMGVTSPRPSSGRLVERFVLARLRRAPRTSSRGVARPFTALSGREPVEVAHAEEHPSEASRVGALQLAALHEAFNRLPRDAAQKFPRVLDPDEPVLRLLCDRRHPCHHLPVFTQKNPRDTTTRSIPVVRISRASEVPGDFQSYSLPVTATRERAARPRSRDYKVERRLVKDERDEFAFANSNSRSLSVTPP